MLGTPKQDQDMRPANPSPYHQKSDIPPAQDVVLHNSASTISMVEKAAHFGLMGWGWA